MSDGAYRAGSSRLRSLCWFVLASLSMACSEKACGDTKRIEVSGDLVKDDSTQMGCLCQIELKSGALRPPERGISFNVCLPPELNMQLDAGAAAIPEPQWIERVDAYCTEAMADVSKKLLALASRVNCDTNSGDDLIVGAKCVHQALPGAPSSPDGGTLATAPNPACATECPAVDCNLANCPNEQVLQKCDSFSTHEECRLIPENCHCTVLQPVFGRMSACGFTDASAAFCLPPPGGPLPPAAPDAGAKKASVGTLALGQGASGLLTHLLSGPHQIEFDHERSIGHLRVKFEDGLGFDHEDIATVHLGGTATLYGFCVPGAECDMRFDVTLYADVAKFHFSKVVCGADCIEDVDVSASRMVATGGMGTLLVHLDSSGRGRIPIGALRVRAESILEGIPKQPMQRTISDVVNDRPLDFHVDFAAKSFMIADVPFGIEGASGTATLFGTVINQPPVPNAGGDRTVECTSPNGATVTLDGSGSTDADNDIFGFQWWLGPPAFDKEARQLDSGATVSVLAPFAPPLQKTTYSLSVFDSHLATRITSTNVTVQDTTPPALSVDANPACLWAPDHKMVLFELGTGISAQAVDACDSAPNVQIVGVTSGQAGTGGGSGNTSPDVRFGKRAFCVRSERAGTQPGPRAYTVTLRASDASGNASVATTVIRVGHDQGSLPCAKVDSSRIVADDDPRCAKD